MRGFLILVSILATLMVWLFWAAPSSHAYREVFAVTRVEWAGSNCIQAYGASQGNPYLIGSPVWTCVAPSAPHWAEWAESRATGQIVGVDPEMGDNAWIKCTLYINGRVEYVDWATAGNGHQVSCLRYVSP